MFTKDTSRPIASVITKIVSDVAYLLQTEIRLAKAELREKLSRAANGAILLGIAAIMLLAGLFVLLLAAVRWLEVAGLPEEWSLLLVGAAVMGAGAGIAFKAINYFKASEMMPDRTIEQVRADVSVIKEHV